MEAGQQSSGTGGAPSGWLGPLRGMRFDLRELAGGLGDLGTFIPIAASLIAVSGLDAGAVLLFAGLANLISGLAFNQPIPVQPMKAIAAVAIAEGLAPGSIAAAGLGMGAVVLVLGLAGAVDFIDRHVPRPLVRGIQLGVGLKLGIKGLQMVGATSAFSLDGWVSALLGGLLLLYGTRRRWPSALILFGAGLLMLPLLKPELLGQLQLGWSGHAFVLPSSAQWEQGLLRGTLPQLPLTLLNSVIAVCALSEDFFPGRGVAPRRMAISVGLMNLVACPFGAMPMCHGAGGLAGQYHFGGRTGGSVVMLGLGKIAVALVFGASAAALLAAYPRSLLGVLLLFAGVELALPARDQKGREAFVLTLLTAAGTMALGTAVGVAMGLVAAWLVPRARVGQSAGQ